MRWPPEASTVKRVPLTGLPVAFPGARDSATATVAAASSVARDTARRVPCRTAVRAVLRERLVRAKAGPACAYSRVSAEVRGGEADDRANGPGERCRAVHGALRRPGRPADPPHHGPRRVDALVGGRLLSTARGWREVRDPL